MPGLIEEQMEPQGGQPQPPQPGEQSPAAAGQGDTARGSKDPILAKIMDQILNGIPPQRKSAVERIVLAGLQVMFAPQMQAQIQKQVNSGDPATSVPEGVAALISIIQSKAQGPLPPPALVPAAIVLMCEAFDYLASAGMLKVDAKLVGEASENMIAFMAQKMNITADTVIQSKQHMARQKQQQGAQAPAPQQQPPAGGV